MSIATSLVFTVEPLLARELTIQFSCNRALLPGQSGLSKSPDLDSCRLVALTYPVSRTVFLIPSESRDFQRQTTHFDMVLFIRIFLLPSKPFLACVRSVSV